MSCMDIEFWVASTSVCMKSPSPAPTMNIIEYRTSEFVVTWIRDIRYMPTDIRPVPTTTNTL